MIYKASGKHKSSDLISIFKTFHWLPILNKVYKGFYQLPISLMIFPALPTSKCIFQVCWKQILLYFPVFLWAVLSAQNILCLTNLTPPHTRTLTSPKCLLLISTSSSSIFLAITSTRRHFLIASTPLSFLC